ncbi:MAG: class I SAM-dependent RNA methyltransferase [Pseudomonadota bacterium]
MTPPRFELFASCPPGLEPWLLEEVRENGWSRAEATAGGVRWQGTWADVWRANLLLRGASRVLIRLGRFRAQHLKELEAKARELPLEMIIDHGTGLTVDATCKKSKIYHSGAAEERLFNAAASFGAILSKEGITLSLRIENNLCIISADTSRDLLHKRGFKKDVAGAPLRETMASLFLRAAGFTGEGPVFDPLCGSGTFVVEAAERAAGLAPGRARSFAFEQFASFDPDAYTRIKDRALTKAVQETRTTFHGSDRSAGAIEASHAYAEASGTQDITAFTKANLSEVKPPEGAKGLVITNPPYGARLGDKDELRALYKAYGDTVRTRFSGWRAALITSDDALAKATGLPWTRPGPWVPHGGLKVRLWQTDPL